MVGYPMRVSPSIAPGWIYGEDRSCKTSLIKPHRNDKGSYLKRVSPSIAPGWIYGEDRSGKTSLIKPQGKIKKWQLN